MAEIFKGIQSNQQLIIEDDEVDYYEQWSERALAQIEKGWIKHALGRTKDYNMIGDLTYLKHNVDKISHVCSIGALCATNIDCEQISKSPWLALLGKMKLIFQEANPEAFPPQHPCIASWNDHPDRTFSQVQKAFQNTVNFLKSLKKKEEIKPIEIPAEASFEPVKEEELEIA